ncbi:DHH family phosphoesterase [Mycoplasma sp. 1654_15]|uniref:DHH family phosphoesterase n=1 Tax=Mycoplasma sp. 1654_15 TaxID=2725994 RepID=UPI001449CB3F|nr:DHH family phosphoesterase [Mycoplasma sp. 1654_15]QJB71367.1 hypothetical protein HF996_02700 [Mycoplasma sp. 1654_15]
MKISKNWLFLFLAVFPILIIWFVLLIFYKSEITNSAFFTILIFLILILIGIFFIVIFYFYKRSINVNNFFYKHFENVLSENGMGVVVFSTDGKIVWASEYILNLYQKTLIGKPVDVLFEGENYRNFFLLPSKFNFSMGDNHLSVQINTSNNWLSIRDITLLDSITSKYNDDSWVIGEIEFDNFQVFSSILNEDEMFSIQNKINVFFENLLLEYDFTYRQYINGKFLIVLNYATFQEWQQYNFDIFQKHLVEKTQIESNTNLNITISTGFAFGIKDFKILNKLAKEALNFSKTRGGNQTTIIKYGFKPFSYGRNSQISVTTSRTNLNYVSKKLLKKLASEDIKKIILYGHINADLDALGAAYALGWFLVDYAKREFKLYNKDFYIQNDTFDATVRRFLSLQKDKIDKKIFIKPKKATLLNDSNTLVILLDTAEKARIENPDAFKNINKDNIFIFDHHGVTSGKPDFLTYGNDYIDTLASSTCEIITEFIALNSYDDKNIPPIVAQMLLNGIYMDTVQFKKSSSSKTFNAASILSNWGASAEEAINILKISEEDFTIINEVIKNLEEVKPGYFLAAIDKPIESDLISIATDYLLNIYKRKAVFVIAKLPNANVYKMSARSLPDTNVQHIAELVGGGGHFSAAAAQSTSESFLEFKDNVINAITGRK